MKRLFSLFLQLSSPVASAAWQLEPYRTPSQGLLWTDGTMQFSRPAGKKTPKLGYAILRARPSKALSIVLPQGTTMAPLPQTLDLNYYLAPIDTLATLQQLSAWAHASTGMCGSIEFVNGTSTITSSTTIYPPIYGSRLSFDAAKILIDQVSLNAMDQTIDTLATLPSRYYRHPTGETAHTTVRQIWEALMISGRWTITEETQSLSQQKTIVARLPGLGKPDETLVIGAHLDSIVSRSGNSAVDNAPGADDDASGVAALTEILRVIENNQLTFDRSIELQAYAAEEVGLVGSKELAAKYAAAGKKIAGMFQIDMAYYSQPDGSGTIHLLQDYTSRDLRRQTIDWIRQYMGQVYELGYLPRGSASDHKAYYDQGYPTVFAFEDPVHYNPYIHSSEDTRAHFDDGVLLRRITQLALLFTFHQGGLQSLAGAYENLKGTVLPIELKQDLPVAIQKVDSNFFLAVSAPLAAKTLEFCLIENGVDQHCSKEREALDKDAAGSARRFFFRTAAVELAAGQKWRILAYDATDELIAWRQFTLNTP